MDVTATLSDPILPWTRHLLRCDWPSAVSQQSDPKYPPPSQYRYIDFFITFDFSAKCTLLNGVKDLSLIGSRFIEMSEA